MSESINFQKLDIFLFCSDVDKAFVLVGGDRADNSQKLYQWILRKSEREEILQMLEDSLCFEGLACDEIRCKTTREIMKVIHERENV
jgi:hypothetical protein